MCSAVSHFLRSHGQWPARLLCPWNFPGNSIGVGCYFLLQVIFLTQGSNPRLLCLLQVDSLPMPPRKPKLKDLRGECKSGSQRGQAGQIQGEAKGRAGQGRCGGCEVMGLKPNLPSGPTHPSSLPWRASCLICEWISAGVRKPWPLSNLTRCLFLYGL